MNEDNEDKYTDLKEYVYTYLRINKKITMVKNQLIRDLDLLYPGLTGIVNIDSKYFIEIINNIGEIINNNYKIKYIDNEKKYNKIKEILINNNINSNAVKYDIDINIETFELLNKQLIKTKNIIEEEYNNMDSKINTISGIVTIKDL